jgi:hypothetical protein
MRAAKELNRIATVLTNMGIRIQRPALWRIVLRSVCQPHSYRCLGEVRRLHAKSVLPGARTCTATRKIGVLEPSLNQVNLTQWEILGQGTIEMARIFFMAAYRAIVLAIFNVATNVTEHW